MPVYCLASDHPVNPCPSAADLLQLAAGLAGVSERPTRVRLEVVPTVDTALGPIRYPRPLILLNTTAGG